MLHRENLLKQSTGWIANNAQHNQNVWIYRMTMVSTAGKGNTIAAIAGSRLMKISFTSDPKYIFFKLNPVYPSIRTC